MCLSIFIPTKAQNTIGKLVVYKKFCKGETTIGILYMFNHPKMPFVDTTNINTTTNMFLNEFGLILSKTKQNKHFQQKITGIDIAGEFWLNQSDKHFFIICLPNRLIDITNRKEYKITEESLLKQMNDWINNLKVFCPETGLQK
jgi:hypothetical protein